MNITWDTDVNAPGCPGQILADDGRSLLIQSDWDYPGVASTFGWTVRDCQCDHEHPCDHDGTDGTVDCKECGMTASEFIASAGDYLGNADGSVVGIIIIGLLAFGAGLLLGWATTGGA